MRGNSPLLDDRSVHESGAIRGAMPARDVVSSVIRPKTLQETHSSHTWKPRMVVVVHERTDGAVLERLATDVPSMPLRLPVW